MRFRLISALVFEIASTLAVIFGACLYSFKAGQELNAIFLILIGTSIRLDLFRTELRYEKEYQAKVNNHFVSLIEVLANAVTKPKA